MRRMAKQILEPTPIYNVLRKMVKLLRRERQVLKWKWSGRPVPPPPIIKRRVLMQYARQYGLKTLVETGTYHGGTIEECRDHFDQIYSIELDKDLFEKATTKFRNEAHIHIIFGDSGSELEKLVDRVSEPALFWLDGHYSSGDTARGYSDTPIMEEVAHIFCSEYRNDVVIIDDARCFGVDPAYPSVEQLSAFVKSKRSDVEIVVRDDSIRITPTESYAR